MLKRALPCLPPLPALRLSTIQQPDRATGYRDATFFTFSLLEHTLFVLNIRLNVEGSVERLLSAKWRYSKKWRLKLLPWLSPVLSPWLCKAEPREGDNQGRRLKLRRVQDFFRPCDSDCLDVL